MDMKREKLNPIVNDILDLVLNVKSGIPEDMIVMMVNYALAEVTSNLRVKLKLYDGQTKPLNNYTYIFAASGVGKDVSLNALNRIFIDSFKDRMRKGFEKHRMEYWDKRQMQLVDEGVEDVETQITEEKKAVTQFSYRLSSATEAGMSKLRVTYGLYKIGAINLVIDELGANYASVRNLVSIMLSSYEDGDTNARQLREQSVVSVKGVPSNFLGYSSPALVFDGGATEKALLDDLSQGMARRSFFAYPEKPKVEKLTAEERVKRSRANADINTKKMEEMNEHFVSLAKPKNMFKEMPLTLGAEVKIAEYQIKCEEIAELNPDMQEQERLELINRAWKATRLAGIYAFISKADKIDVEHIEQAIYISDVSGQAFTKVMNQPPVYERLFNFIKARSKTSQIDLEKQSWFSGNAQYKKNTLQLARAYGYENDYLFRIKEVEGVEFYSFVEIPKTDVDKIYVSISKDIAKGFKRKKVPFEVLHEVVCNPSYNYSAGTFKGGHRKASNYEQKQNLIIIDIDDGLKLETAKLMFANYKCLIATTRNHQKEKNGLVCDRFRIIFITDRTIQLAPDMYARFMENVYESLGVPADESCKDCSRMFYGAEGYYWYSDGTKLFEIADMIPDTTKETERKVMLSKTSIGSTEGVERFLLEEAVKGSRNNTMVKYALFLKDSGYDYETAESKVLDFNDKLPESLSVKEVKGTILKTLKRKYNGND